MVEDTTRDFADAFARQEQGPCRIYLISPQDVGGTFPDRLKAALEPGLATAFQLRVKDREEHELAPGGRRGPPFRKRTAQGPLSVTASPAGRYDCNGPDADAGDSATINDPPAGICR